VCTIASLSAPVTTRAISTPVAQCPTPPSVFNGTFPTFPAVPAATVESNLVLDPGFEQEGVRVGELPTGFGYWRGDGSASVPTQQAIAPQSGAKMLQFISTAPSLPPPNRVTSEQVQLIDVSALRSEIDAGQITASGQAWFTRVAGCAETDAAFGMQLIAHDGGPETVQERWLAGIAEAASRNVPRESLERGPGFEGSWLRYRAGAIGSHSNPGTWLPINVSLPLPAGTTVIQVVIFALETQDDAAFPEFHGHYAEDVSVVLSRP
jgi:hypothetical protein